MKPLGQRLVAVAVSFVAVASVAFSCRVRRVDSGPEPPLRPAGVPAQAVWAGGIDGGSFIELEPTAKANQYLARIYGDTVGDIEFDGVLKVDQRGALPLDLANPKIFSFWDGNTLHLTDGRTLSPGL